MVADPPENHLCRHALVDLVQQLFDEPSACFSGHKLERAAAVKLSFRGAKPTPCAFAVSEDLFSQRGDTREAYGPVRFFPAQRLPARATMRQRASRHHQRVDLIV